MVCLRKRVFFLEGSAQIPPSSATHHAFTGSFVIEVLKYFFNTFSILNVHWHCHTFALCDNDVWKRSRLGQCMQVSRTLHWLVDYHPLKYLTFHYFILF
jgi:hypothetical protein